MSAFAVGPAHIYFITDLETGTGYYITDMESVTFTPGTSMLGTSNAFSGDAWDSQGLYSLPPAPQVELELYDIDRDAIKNLVFGSEVFDGDTQERAIGLGKPGLTKIDAANIPTLFILPDIDAAAGINSEIGIWLPACATESLSGIAFNRPTSGGNKNSYSATVRGARRTKLGTQDVPESAQLGWIGDPVAVGFDLTTTPWTLPSESE